MRWAGHVVYVAAMKNAYISGAISDGKKPLGRPSRSGRMTIKWILNRIRGRGMDSTGYWIESSDGKNGNEPSGSIKYGEF